MRLFRPALLMANDDYCMYIRRLDRMSASFTACNFCGASSRRSATISRRVRCVRGRCRRRIYDSVVERSNSCSETEQNKYPTASNITHSTRRGLALVALSRLLSRHSTSESRITAAIAASWRRCCCWSGCGDMLLPSNGCVEAADRRWTSDRTADVDALATHSTCVARVR